MRAILELPTAARVAYLGLAGVDTNANGQRSAGLRLPLLVERGKLAEHRQRGSTSADDMVFLRDGGIPHGQDSVAGVIDDHTALRHDLFRKSLHHVADDAATHLGAEALRKVCEAAQVANQNGHFLISA